ncbi:hypothetical protein [Octadecabacter ascidiaceicola]|uniref:Uncharacterized protein n=1 Tax=Octadecabacter ascidiaceicola TaxID=1655543 RepID=A0A238K851_9RHOB|nr:hypothetical protein [Octadecabacter ascidiaceicola]SMX39039.1 hypothetical protein OCA8868_01803 [Octadecabacter ascidiaceicola]
MPYRGAGGTNGGEGSFLIGIIMMIAGGYLLLKGIMVRPQFGFGNQMFAVGGFPVTTGLVLVPFAFGVGMIFYNSRNWIGWVLALGSVLALVVGVIASINFTLVRMSAFDLLMIMILLIGGIGLFLRSLRGR